MSAKVIDKVVKLIALTSSSNEHEARNAAMQACRLIREHKLTFVQKAEVAGQVPSPRQGPQVKEQDIDFDFMTEFFNSVVRNGPSRRPPDDPPWRYGPPPPSQEDCPPRGYNQARQPEPSSRVPGQVTHDEWVQALHDAAQKQQVRTSEGRFFRWRCRCGQVNLGGLSLDSDFCSKCYRNRRL